jgi:hypothetical protein
MPNFAHQDDDVHRPRPKICKELGQRLSVSLACKTNCPSLVAWIDNLQRLNGMKDFSNASFPPEVIQVMTLAMKSALSTLPHPVSSTHVQSVAETILRTAKDGERDPKVLERMALLELQISSRH